MDVFTAGRMAMLQDRQGASFGIWQPQDHIGCRVKGDPGAIAWNELLTTDPQDAIDFYESLLGVENVTLEGPMEYTMLKAGGTEVAGVMGITSEMGPVPPNLMVYFSVANVDGSASQAASLGATLLMPGMDIPGIGGFATIQNPQGAVFSIFAGV